jgi:hypothetical protein
MRLLASAIIAHKIVLMVHVKLEWLEFYVKSA